MNCKYWDCGWCYAPDNVETNATQGGCFEPNHCPYLKSQMTETTLKLTLEELQLLDKYVELNAETQQLFEKIKDAYPERKMELVLDGDFVYVSYDDKRYYRMSYKNPEVVWWFENLATLECPFPHFAKIIDGKLNKKLENLYQEQVVVKE